MPTTTNYGWTTPADTDLVKDGASAIRTLGSSVDTTVKNLNPSTTLGDIEYRSSTANTNTRLAIGTTGQVLTVAGGVPSWATPATSAGMTLINTGGTTLTGSSVTISSIPGTYNNLQLFIVNFRPVNTNNYIALRLNNDSTANRHVTVASFEATNASFDNTEIYCSSGTNNSASQALVIVDIYDYANTTTWKTVRALGFTNSQTTSTNYSVRNVVGAYNQTDAITSLNIRALSSDMTSGTAYLYGVK